MKKFLQCAVAALAVAAIGLVTNVKAQVSVLAEIHRTGTSSSGTYLFTSIPSNTSTDLINGLTATIISGQRNGNGAQLSALTNGVGATSADQPSRNFFAQGDCRLAFDMGSNKFVGKINTYSWHPGDRAPQIYDVYAAVDGVTPDYTGLTNFTKIASVDTTSTGTTPLSAASEAAGNGGQHGVSISGINTNYRYIVFDTFNRTGNATFYSEMDVVSGPPPPPAAPTALTATAPYAGVVLSWNSVPLVDYYNVYRSVKSGSGYTKLGSTSTTTYSDSAVTTGSTYYYVVTSVNSTGESAFSNEAAITPAHAAVVGVGDGLTGRYYTGDDTNFTPLGGTPFLTQVDPVINFNDNGNTTNYNPTVFDSGVPATNFTTRWSGQFLSPITGPVTFTTIADDGVRLYVTDTTTPVINDALFQGPTTTSSAPISLVAGQKYTIIMDYFQGGGGDTAQLLYSYPGLPLAIVPQSQLYSTVAIAPATPTNLTAYAGVEGASVILNWTEPTNLAPTPTFNILRSGVTGGSYTTIATGVTGLTYTDATTTLGSTYYYVVTATNAIGTSGNSNEAAITPAKPAQVIYYTFENGPQGLNPDVIKDFSPKGNDGSAAGGDEGFTTDAAHGKYAGIVANDPNNQFLSLPSGFDFGNQFTFFCNTKLPINNGITTIFSSHAVFGYGGWSLYVNNNGDMSEDLVFETNGSVQVKATSAAGLFPLGDGNFHAVAAVVNRTAGLVDVYLDGTQVISAGVIGADWPTASTQETLGIFPPPMVNGTGEFFRIVGAEFDDVQVFNGLLNAADVAALNVPTGTVTGAIALEGVNNLSAVSQYAPLGTFHITFRTPGTMTVVQTADVSLTATPGSANGTFSVSGVPAGTYDVLIKGAKNLAVLSPGVVVSATGGTIPAVSLPAGDANGDNSVDSTDFGLLIGEFNLSGAIANSGYDPAEDFNFDGSVDSTDFGLLIGEFNNMGAK